MKKIKIILGILVVLFVLLVIAVLVVGAHLGDIVKAGMQDEGPKFTQTPLTVDSVNVSLLGGSAGIKNFVLGNPEGYKASQSISFSNAAVSLVPGSVLSDKIVIHSIEVRAPEITFEGNPIGDNNLMKILDNVKAATGSGASTQAVTPATPAATNAPAGTAKAGKKLEVDDFVISGAVVHANITGILTKELTVPIPDIHLTGLGAGPDGITAADLTKIVLNEITAQTVKTLASSAKELGKGATDAAEKSAQDAANGTLQKAGITNTNAVNNLKQGLNSLLGK